MDNPRYKVVEDEKYYYIVDTWLNATIYKCYYKHTADAKCGRLNRNWKKHTYLIIKRVGVDADD